MQQHPIPQNVTAYEFHLIGNMTVKQFLELGAGIGVGFLIYNMALPDVIKWPLIVFAVIVGGAMAFLPFDGRPLDRMIIVFFKSIYSPTQFIWRKTAIVPKYFTYKTKAQSTDAVGLERQKMKKNLGEYLSSLPQEPTTNPLDDIENKYLYSVSQMFGTVQAASGILASTTTITPTAPNIRVRGLKIENQLPATNPTNRTIKAASIQVPENKPTAVATKKPTSVLSKKTQTEANPLPLPLPDTQTLHTKSKSTTLTEATTKTNLPFPELPKTPNTIVGMVLTSQGKIIENAIVEIRDQNHMPIRALKSNKLGQFFSATPLPEGKYTIGVEKDNYHFDTQQLSLKNDVVSPLEIRARE